MMKPILSFLSAAAFLPVFPLMGADSMAPIDPVGFKQPVRVACVGDSITQGGRRGKYPEKLQEMLGEKWQVMNFGHSGRTLLKKGDHSYWKSDRYTKALESKPDVVIIKLGTNDTKPQNWKFKDEFVADYKALIVSFQKLESKPRIYLCKPCPVVGKGNFGITNEGVQEQIPLIEAMAKEMNLGVIDMNATLKDKPELIPDRVHPNGRGYTLMAATAAKVLTGKEAPVPVSTK